MVTKANRLTHNGRLRKWGAIENRKQKQTAKILEGAGVSREIDFIGRVWLDAFKLEFLIQIGLIECGECL